MSSDTARRDARKRVRIFRWLLALVPALALGWAVFIWLFPRPTPLPPRAFVADADGMPRADVVFVGLDGAEVRPDPRGIVAFPSQWAGKTVSVRDRRWQEITTIVVSHPGDGLQRILTPRAVEGG